MKTLLKKQDYQTLDQELQDMLEDIPTAEQLVTSGNVLENNPDLKTTKKQPQLPRLRHPTHPPNCRKNTTVQQTFLPQKESFICRVMLALDSLQNGKNTAV